MARYLGPKCRLSRREGTDLFLKSGIRPLDSKCKAEQAPGHAAHCQGRPPHQDRQAAPELDRWPYHPARGLCRQPAHPQAHRRRLRLGQELGRFRQDPPSRPPACRLDVHADGGGLQPGAPPEAGRSGLTMPRVRPQGAGSRQKCRNDPPQSRVKRFECCSKVGKPKPATHFSAAC